MNDSVGQIQLWKGVKLNRSGDGTCTVTMRVQRKLIKKTSEHLHQFDNKHSIKPKEKTQPK